MKNARAKRAKTLFFIVNYANLWGFCCRRRRGCLSSLLNWTTSEWLLGVHVDSKMTWSDHVANLAKSIVSKLCLLRRMQFLHRKQLEDFYAKVILPSVTYGLVVWGSCYKTHFSNLEKLRARAGRIVYGLSWDISTADV